MATALSPSNEHLAAPFLSISTAFLPRREVELGPGTFGPRHRPTCSSEGALLGDIGILHLFVGHRLPNRAPNAAGLPAPQAASTVQEASASHPSTSPPATQKASREAFCDLCRVPIRMVLHGIFPVTSAIRSQP